MEQNILISQNKRVAYLDTLRVLACLMVVLVHSPVAHTYLKEAPIYGIVSYLCSPCIGLFLMVSGALLLPTTLNLRQFLTRRFSRILWPLIIWSVIYIFVDAINCGRPIFNIFSSILHIPFGPTAKFVQSWYLYTLLGIYLFIPIFNTWIKNNDRRNSLYFILIWSVALINPFLKALPTGGCTPPYIFAEYFGYIALGYYLHNYPIKLTSLKTFSTMSILLIVIAGIIPAIIYLANIPGYDTYSNIIYNYLSLSSMTMCLFIYTFVQNFNPQSHIFQKIMAHLSPLTFGIFLVNYAIIYYIFFPYFTANPLSNLSLEIAIVFVGSFAISYIITLIINYLPFKKYIIG